MRGLLRQLEEGITTKRAKDLKPGDVVVSETGARRTVQKSPKSTKARGYVYVITDGEPVNCHGDDPISIAESRLASIGNPDFRAAGVMAFARKIRDFAGELAMQTAARGEPEAEIVAENPKVRGALKDALAALGKLGKAILDTERGAIDITPHVAGLLRAEEKEAGHLSRLQSRLAGIYGLQSLNTFQNLSTTRERDR